MRRGVPVQVRGEDEGVVIDEDQPAEAARHEGGGGLDVSGERWGSGSGQGPGEG